MSTTSKAISNSLYLFLDWLVLMVFGYVFWFLMGKMLPPSDVGVFATVTNLANMILVFTFLGLNSSVIKMLSEYQAKNAADKISGTIRWSSQIVLGLNFLLAIAIIILSPQLATFGYLDATALKFLGVVLMATASLLLTSSYLYSLQMMRLLLTTDFLIGASKLSIAAGLIILGFGYFGALAGYCIAVLAFSLLRYKWLPTKKGKLEKKKLWGYATIAYAGGFGLMAVNQGSVVLLSLLAPMASVGIFSLAFMFTTPVRLASNVISYAIIPIMSQKWALKEEGSLKTIISRAFKYALFFAVPPFLAFTVFSREFILFVSTPQYLAGAAILPILALAYIFFGFSDILTGSLYYAGKPKTNRNISLTAGLINIVLSVLLIPVFGIEGAALAFLTSTAVLFLASLYFAHRHIAFPLFGRQLLKNAVAALMFLAVLLFAKQIDNSPAMIIGSMAIGGAAYVLLLLYIKFFDEIDLNVLTELTSKTPKRLKAIPEYAMAMLGRHI